MIGTEYVSLYRKHDASDIQRVNMTMNSTLGVESRACWFGLGTYTACVKCNYSKGCRGTLDYNSVIPKTYIYRRGRRACIRPKCGTEGVIKMCRPDGYNCREYDFTGSKYYTYYGK